MSDHLKNHVPPLPKHVLAKIDHHTVSELYLGKKEGFSNKKVSRGWLIFAGLLWVIPFGIESTVGSTDSSAKILALSTLGFILAVTRLPKFLSGYEGPVWPAAGRFGQRIDKPSPPILLRFLGWILLVTSFLFFVTKLLMT